MRTRTRKFIRNLINSLRRLFKLDKNLVINKYEVALFPKDFFASDLNLLLQELKKIDVFTDGVNTLIPIPNNAPREIPRLLLRSKDTTIGCNISFEKINIFWLNTKEKVSFTKSTSELNSIVDKISSILLSHTPTKKVRRVGFIKEYYYETEEPVKIISGKTIYDSVSDNLKDFILQFTYKLGDLNSYSDCNEVVIINSNAVKQIDKKKVLMITHDINTIQTQDISWGIQDIRDFITETNAKSDKENLVERFLVQNAES